MNQTNVNNFNNTVFPISDVIAQLLPTIQSLLDKNEEMGTDISLEDCEVMLEDETLPTVDLMVTVGGNRAFSYKFAKVDGGATVTITDYSKEHRHPSLQEKEMPSYVLTKAAPEAVKPLQPETVEKIGKVFSEIDAMRKALEEMFIYIFGEGVEVTDQNKSQLMGLLFKQRTRGMSKQLDSLVEHVSGSSDESVLDAIWERIDEVEKGYYDAKAKDSAS